MWKELVWPAMIWFGFAKMEIEELEGDAGSHFHYLEYNTYSNIYNMYFNLYILLYNI